MDRSGRDGGIVKEIEKRKCSFSVQEKIINCTDRGNSRTEVIAVTNLRVRELHRGNKMERQVRHSVSAWKLKVS